MCAPIGFLLNKFVHAKPENHIQAWGRLRHIDVACARSRNITVAIASDANAQSVVEHTFMFMLNMAKNSVYMDQVVRSDYSQRKNIKAFDLGARTLLVLGYGRIGTRSPAS